MPLLVVAAAYLGAAARHGPRLLGRRGGSPGDASRAALSLLSAFPAVGLAAAAYGVVLAVQRERPVGGIWLTFGLALLLAVPGLLALASGQAPEDGEPSDQVKSRAAISNSRIASSRSPISL